MPLGSFLLDSIIQKDVAEMIGDCNMDEDPIDSVEFSVYKNEAINNNIDQEDFRKPLDKPSGEVKVTWAGTLSH